MATGQLAGSERGPLRLRGTPVFLYHGLTRSPVPDGPRRQRKYWVAAEQFREHLDCISKESYQTVLLRELWDSGDVEKRENPATVVTSEDSVSPHHEVTLPLPIEAGIRAEFFVNTVLLRKLWDSAKVAKRENPATVVTFDDGLSLHYEVALPLLIEAGMRAEFFVNTANVGTRGFLSWPQMSEMRRAGMSFQSHSHDHMDLAKLPLREKQHQLKHSKQTLEDALGSEVDFLAVPFGCLSREVVRVAIETGYRAVCTSRSWPARPGGRLVNRVVVYRHTSSRTFRELLIGSPASYAIRAARAAALFFPKHIRSLFPKLQERATGLETLT